jgi:hypothetical protein
MPVVIASDNPTAVAEVLKEYAGIAGVQCLSEEESVCEDMHNTLKRYSAKLLTIDKEIVSC